MTLRHGSTVAFLLLALATMPAPLLAQSRRPPLRPPQPPPTQTNPTFTTAGPARSFVTFGSAFQVTSASFDSSIRPLEFAERAIVDTRYSTPVLPGFAVGGGTQVWRNMAIAVDVERVSKSGNGTVSAQVPHPFFFNRLRPVAGDATELHRVETDVHIQAMWTWPVTRRIDLSVAAGPSWMRLSQDIVSDVTVAQTYPYDTATFDGVVAPTQTEAGLGFNAGVTVDYRLAQRVGLVVTTRFSRARLQFDTGDSGPVGVTAGGGHVGAGLRFRF